MTRFVVSLSRARNPESMAKELAEDLSEQLTKGVAGEGCEAKSPAGALILATAAAGHEILEVGERLAERWLGAPVLGTSFEGVIAEGCLYRDEPAVAVIAWAVGASEGPIPLILNSAENAADRMAAEIRDLTGRLDFEPGDLIVLFPDAHHSPRFEVAIADLGPMLAPACVAGSGASGFDGYPANTFFGGEGLSGAIIGLFIPAGSSGDPRRVGQAGATRAASPWLEITKCRSRWIDELDGEPALDWVRRQLGFDERVAIEPYLDRLLARVRLRTTIPDSSDDREYQERYVIGLDARRGSFSWPGTFSRGDELALALPDAARARERLGCAVDDLAPSSLLFQFACRARDEALHGDPGLEAAWLAHCAGERRVIGTIAPFQIAMSAKTEACRMLVHSTVLAALGHP